MKNPKGLKVRIPFASLATCNIYPAKYPGDKLLALAVEDYEEIKLTW